jgi:hypothetical protein
MLTEDKQLLLSGFLGRLPDRVAARLAKAVEVDRLIGGNDLPHEEILRALRPQLRTVPDKARTQTPQRFFCRPFEDLLVSPDRSAKQKGRIARSTIEPVWNWLAIDLMPARHRQITEALRDAILHDRDSEIEERSVELWSECAFVLKKELATEKQRAFAAKKLGGVAAVEDAAEMALLMIGGREIAQMQSHLPKPIVALTEEDNRFLRETFDQLSESMPDIASYVPLIVLGRHERPWEVLHLVGILGRKMTDTVIANTDLGVTGELLFSDLDEYAKKIQAARPMDFDPDMLVTNLAAFSELSSGIVKELGIRRDGKWGQRLAKDRGTVSEALENLLERAPKDILAALPVARMGSFAKGTQKPLDLSRQPDPDRVAKAMRYANLIVHSRPFSVAAAFSARLKETVDELSEILRTYAEDLIRELRAGPSDTRAHMEEHWALVLSLCSLILGEQETDLLRRRAKVPVAAAG